MKSASLSCEELANVTNLSAAHILPLKEFHVIFPPAFLEDFGSLLETRYATAKCFTTTLQGPFLSLRLEMHYRWQRNTEFV
jgi:hypothetical protein